MARYARSERLALADLLTDVGPDAPTVNEGWTARDLAAHLVARDRRPDAGAGILLRPLRGHGERVRRTTARVPFAHLVELIRRPPWWSPVSNPLLDSVTNTLEFFIHHEDIRRARPGWRPRNLPPNHHAALWRLASPMGRLRLRRFGARVCIRAPGYGAVTTGAGGTPAYLTGTPAELALFLSGRQRVARVDVDAPAPLAEELMTVRIGF